jgi:hypothetical protein
MDLLTTYTHHSELQAITALSLIYALYKSPHAVISSLQCFQQPFPGLTVDMLQLSALRSFLQDCSTELTANYQLHLAAPILFFIIPLRGRRRQHPVSPIAYVTVAAGTCLPSRCLTMGCTTPLFIHLLHCNGSIRDSMVICRAISK